MNLLFPLPGPHPSIKLEPQSVVAAAAAAESPFFFHHYQQHGHGSHQGQANLLSHHFGGRVSSLIIPFRVGQNHNYSGPMRSWSGSGYNFEPHHLLGQEGGGGEADRRLYAHYLRPLAPDSSSLMNESSSHHHGVEPSEGRKQGEQHVTTRDGSSRNELGQR